MLKNTRHNFGIIKVIIYNSNIQGVKLCPEKGISTTF